MVEAPVLSDSPLEHTIEYIQSFTHDFIWSLAVAKQSLQYRFKSFYA